MATQKPLVRLAKGYLNASQGFPFMQPVIISDVAPGNSDAANPGQIWLNKITNLGYILISETFGVYTWASLGGTTFAGLNLTVNPGPTDLTGQFQVHSNVNAAGALLLEATGGLLARLVVSNTLGNGVDAIEITANSGGIDVTSALDIAMNPGADFVVTAGNDINFVAAGNISFNPGLATNITVAAGDLTLGATTGSVVVTSGEAVGDAIQLTTAAGGGIDINAGTAGMTIDSTGVLSIDSAGATNLTATGAFDVTVQSTAGSILINAGEAVSDAINVDSTGGFDLDAALQINLTSTQNAATAISLNASAGAIELQAQGAAGEDIVLNNVAGSVNLVAGEAVANALRFAASAGGIDVDAALQINIASAQAAAADSVRIVASAANGGMDIDAGTGGITIDSTGVLSLDAAGATNLTATGAFDVTVNSTAGSVVITGAEAVVDAIQLNALTALGGIDVNAGTGGMTVDSAGLLSLDANAASNLTVTGAFDLTVNSTLGRLVLNSEQAAADALRVVSAAGGLDANVALQMNLDSSEAAINAVRIVASNAGGGIDIDAGTTGITIDSTGVLSLDAAGATNLTATGVFDLTVNSTAGSVILNGGEAVLDAIQLTTAAGGGIDINAGTAGMTIDSTGVLSLDAAGNTNLTTTGAFTMLVASTAGATTVSSAKAADNAAVLVSASAADGGITLDAGVVPGVRLTNGTQTVQFLVGTGAPVGVAALQGSIFLNVAGTGADSLYVNTDGGTTWSAR